MNKPKIGIITQARVGSSRLPGKTLLKIQNESLLEIHFKRLLEAGVGVYLATTTEADAYKLIEVANKFNIPSKVGSLDDVLSRYYLCAKEHKLEVIVRVTSDCPLISGEIIKRGLDEYLAHDNFENIYYSNTQKRMFPRGLDFEIFSFKLLEEAYLECLEMRYREHVTPYLYSKQSSKVVLMDMDYEDMGVADWRLCVDTKEDFELIEKLLKDPTIQKSDYRQLVTILKKNEDLKKINSEINQKHI